MRQLRLHSFISTNRKKDVDHLKNWNHSFKLLKYPIYEFDFAREE